MDRRSFIKNSAVHKLPGPKVRSDIPVYADTFGSEDKDAFAGLRLFYC